MSPIKKGSAIRRIREIGIGGSLAVVLMSNGWLVSSCSSANDETSYSYEEVADTLGVRSYIKEIRKGEFTITKEESVKPSEAGAVVTYLDGRTETITPEQAKTMVESEINTATNGTSEYRSSSSGLSSMLLYGGLGYMMGRSMGGSNIASFREQNRSNAAGVYSSPAAYQNSQSVMRNVESSRTTRVVNSRPSGGRSGFFGRSASRSGG
jgi:hypothetical protein